MPSDAVYIDIIANATHAIANIAQLGAAYLAVSKIIKTAIRIGTDLIKEFQGAEQSAARLASAFRVVGVDTSGMTNDMLDFAAGLMKTTLYTDESTQAAIMLGRTIAGLDSDQLKQIIPRIQDFATAMGFDLNQAARMVFQSFEGGRNMLGKYGIEINKEMSASERFATIVAGLTDKFGGMAKAVGDTATGALLKAGMAMSELKEEGGRAIVRFLAPFAEAYRKIAEKATEALKAHNDLMDALDREKKGTDTLADRLILLDDKLKELQRTHKDLDYAVGNAAYGYDMLTGAAKDLATPIREAIFDNEKLTFRLLEEGTAVERLMKAEKKRADAVPAAAKAAADRIAAIAEEEKQLMALYGTTTPALIAMADRWTMLGMIIGTQIPQATINARNQFDMLFRALDKEVPQAEINVRNLFEMQERYFSKPKKAMKEASAGWQDYTSLVQDSLGSMGDMWGDYYGRQLEDQSLTDEQRKALLRKQAETEKAMALFQAMIGIPIAILQGLKSGGPILAALAGIAATAQLAAVASTPLPALAEGGVATRPTVAMIGERGPEAVIPLGRGFGPRVTVFVYGSVMEGEDLARKIWAIGARQRRGY